MDHVNVPYLDLRWYLALKTLPKGTFSYRNAIMFCVWETFANLIICDLSLRTSNLPQMLLSSGIWGRSGCNSRSKWKCVLEKQASQQSAKKQKQHTNFFVTDRAEIGQYTCRYIDEYRYSSWKKTTASGTYSATFTYCCYTTQGRKHPLPLLLLEPASNVHLSMSTCPLTTPTKSHPHKFKYCDPSFAMPSALVKFTKVKFHAKHYSIMVFCGDHLS